MTSAPRLSSASALADFPGLGAKPTAPDEGGSSVPRGWGSFSSARRAALRKAKKVTRMEEASGSGAGKGGGKRDYGWGQDSDGESSRASTSKAARRLGDVHIHPTD